VASKELVYSVRLDAASAQAQATQLRSAFQSALQNMQVNLLDPNALNSALTATQGIRAQLDAAANSSQAAVLALQQANASQLVGQFDQVARDAQNAAQSMQQAASARPQQQPQGPIGGGQGGGGQSGGNGLGILGNAVLGGVAGYYTVQGAQMIANQAEAFAEFGTQVRRTEASFKILSGSAAEAEARINAIKEASNGTVTELQAMQIANQASNLHLADTAKGMGDITRAAKEITLVSPSVHDMNDALAQLSLFAANAPSFARADQLGLSAGEVKARMKELQDANASLDDSQAKLQASMQLLNEKFSPLMQSTEAQASGVEKLKVAFSDLWAEMAKGPVGKSIDGFFGDFANAIGDVTGKVTAADTAFDEIGKRIEMQSQKGGMLSFLNAPAISDTSTKRLEAQRSLLKEVGDDVKRAYSEGVPGAKQYSDALDEIARRSIINKEVSSDDMAKLRQIKTEYEAAAKAAKEFGQLSGPASAKQSEASRNKVTEERVTGLFEPVKKLGDNLKGIGLDNFFNQLHDGLAKSAEITATENNHLATLRQQLVDIGRAVADSNGNITNAQRQQVTAINQQIEALTRAASLNEKLKTGDKGGGGGQDLDAIYTRLNAIVAQTRGIFDETANAARALGDAIAQSGNASADQLAQIQQLAEQANQADFSRIADSLRELNSGSLDAVPGVDSLRDKLTSLYDVLASGKGLTADQAAELASLSAQADMLGGSTSALAAIQDQLGYSFLNSHEYVSALVQQVANLEALYGSGAIGADQFAGGMNALTGELYSQLAAAGRLTPQLAQLLTMLNAVKAASGGGTFGPPGPGQGFFGGFGGGGTVNTNSSGYLAGQAQAQAAAAAARSKADAGAREEAIKAQKHAAGAAQSAFEDAAKGTQKAFEAVVDDMRSALQKVEGLFSPSKVTAEDMALSKAGVYNPKADELLRQVKSAAENEKDKGRFASQIAQAREALQRIGIAPAENLKAMAAQLEQAWSSSALFSNKENLKLINADAVKFQLNLAAKAKEGQENIYEYFGATLDGVKEKFKAGDPATVDAVAAELQASQDKNLKALGKSLEDHVSGAVDKALANLAAAEAGFGKGGGGGGGGGVSVGAIPTSGGGGTWIDTVSKNVGNAYQNMAAQWSMGYGASVPKTNAQTGGLYGPPAPNGLNATGLQTDALTGTLKITAVELDTSTAGTGVAALVNKIAAQFDDPANRAVLAAKGPQMSSLIQASFTELAVYQPMAAPLVNEIVRQFDDPANRAVLAAKGPQMSSLIQRSFTELATFQPMAGSFVNEIKAQFDDPANKAVEASIGLDISDNIQRGVKELAEYPDMTVNLVQALSTQFLNEQNVINYKAIGQAIKDQIVQAIGSVSDIQNSINAGSLSNEKEGADGKTRRKSAFDFGPTVDQVNQSLSRSFGGSSDFMRGIGDSMATFIGFGMTDHDFSTTSAMVIGALSASFQNDQARNQLIGVGSTISGAIFAGFTSSLSYQPWLSTLVQTVVQQAMESMTNSINDSLKTQAVGL